MLGVGLNHEIIIDYSVHDAIKAGFNKIIFIIRKDIEEDFKERIGNRVEKTCDNIGVEVAYCFQSFREVPEKVGQFYLKLKYKVKNG